MTLQEIEVLLLYTYPEVYTVKGKERQNVVFVLQKFTIPNDKILEVEIFDKIEIGIYGFI